MSPGLVYLTWLLASMPRSSAGASSAAQPTIVVLVPDGDEVEDQLLDAVLGHGQGLPCVVVPVRESPPFARATDVLQRSRLRAAEYDAFAVIWVVLGSEQDAVILFERQLDRLSWRRLPRGESSPAVAVETLGNVVASVAAEAVLGPVASFEPWDSEPAPPPAPRATTSPKPLQTRTPRGSVHRSDPPSRRVARLWVGTGWVGNTFAPQLPWQDGIMTELVATPGRGAAIGVRFDVVVPSRERGPQVAFELRRHPVSITTGYRFVFARRRADVELAARASVDPVLRRAGAVDSALAATADRVRVLFAAGGRLGVGWRPVRERLRFSIQVGPDVLLSRTRWVARAPSVQPLVDPDPVRFVVEVGVQVGLLRRTPRK